MLTSRSKLAFRWAIALDGEIHESDVHIRADHAAERGVHFPAAWKMELNLGVAEPVVDVEALAHAAVQRARAELSLSDATMLDCRQSSQAYTHTYEHEHAHAYSSTVITLLKVCWRSRCYADMAQQARFPLDHRCGGCDS